MLIDIQQNDTLLIAPFSDTSFPELFRGDKSYAHLRVTAGKLFVSIWQFAQDHDRIGPRSYNFAKLRQALIEEASGHNCIIFPLTEQPLFMKIQLDLVIQDKGSWGAIVRQFIYKVKEISRDVELNLQGGPKWRPEYFKDEPLFRNEVLEKLLKRLFQDVYNNHGNREHGKDFTFTVVSNLGRQYGAVQAKAGNLDGKSGGKLDQILSQLDDAFSIPYYAPQTSDERYISVFVIAISGSITPEGRGKLFHKLSKQRRLGAVLLWTKEDIEGLIHNCWSDNYESIHKTNWNLRIDSTRL